MEYINKNGGFLHTTSLPGSHKSNVLPDMLSGCIEYKDLRSEKHTYKLAIGSKRIEKSLYSIPADCKSAGTLALLVLVARTTLAFGFLMTWYCAGGSVLLFLGVKVVIVVIAH